MRLARDGTQSAVQCMRTILEYRHCLLDVKALLTLRHRGQSEIREIYDGPSFGPWVWHQERKSSWSQIWEKAKRQNIASPTHRSIRNHVTVIFFKCWPSSERHGRGLWKTNVPWRRPLPHGCRKRGKNRWLHKQPEIALKWKKFRGVVSSSTLMCWGPSTCSFGRNSKPRPGPDRAQSASSRWRSHRWQGPRRFPCGRPKWAGRMSDQLHGQGP